MLRSSEGCKRRFVVLGFSITEESRKAQSGKKENEGFRRRKQRRRIVVGAGTVNRHGPEVDERCGDLGTALHRLRASRALIEGMGSRRL
ncbi:hypothetical protein U1Q18_031825 [Sarracenia purpurea var. burkii]